jgi:hypothetical protein
MIHFGASVYARCVVGLEGVWIGRMDQALHLEENQ